MEGAAFVQGMRLDRTKDHVGVFAAGEYPGWDRWGRVVRHMWADGAFGVHATEIDVPNLPPIVEEVYAYDRSSNRTRRIDARPGAQMPDRDFAFAYDPLDRLQFSTRGVVDGNGDIPPANAAAGGHEWVLDLLGNWDVMYTDSNGDGDWRDQLGDSTDSRTHNDANELKNRVLAGLVGANLDLTHDKAGNRATEELGSAVSVYVHDAWNRLVRVERIGSPNVIIAEYAYNGLHWRIERAPASKHSTGGGTSAAR